MYQIELISYYFLRVKYVCVVLLFYPAYVMFSAVLIMSGYETLQTTVRESRQACTVGRCLDKSNINDTCLWDTLRTLICWHSFLWQRFEGHRKTVRTYSTPIILVQISKISPECLLAYFIIYFINIKIEFLFVNGYPSILLQELWRKTTVQYLHCIRIPPKRSK